MKGLNDLSIRSKLIAINVVSASIALTLACAGLFLFELRTYRQSLEHEALAMAQMVAATSTAAITFADRTAASENLRALQAEPNVLASAIYSREGGVFASYARDGKANSIPKTAGPVGFSMEGQILIVFEPVELDGEQIGWIFLRIDGSEASERLLQYLYIMIGVFIASMAVTAVVSSILQRLVSQPILHLAETANRVARDKDYTLRAEKEREDEIGRLVDQFNGMLGEIHERDEALRQAQDHLENRVRERTHELEVEIVSRRVIEENLRSAMAAAEEANRSKSAFLANMSHELRTPLNAIIGYSEMLEEDAVAADSNPGGVDDLRKIRGAGLHLLTLINEILDLSKIEAGKMELHYESIDVPDLLREIQGIIEPLAIKNGNRLSVEMPVEPVQLEADLVRFRQSLLNLASNACRFTQDGQVKIAVHSYCENRRDWLAFAVRDSGVGIPADQIGKLFHSFSQVDSSRTRKHGGSGLGLAISQKLCSMMEGRITVDSVQGGGSTFTIHIPRQRREPSAAGAVAKPETSPSAGQAKRPSRLLLIEDDFDSRQLLERQFAREGIRVDSASNGEEALVMVKRHDYLAIVLDLKLPGLSGFEVIEQLHGGDGPLPPPIFVYSILDPDALPARLRSAIRGFFQKPLGADGLVSAVIRVLVDGQASQLLESVESAGEPSQATERS